MRVYEVAKELGTTSEGLVHLLREMQVPVRSHMSAVADEHVARLRTMIERQRKSGHEDAKEAVEAALEEAQAKPRRRRRKREDIPAKPEPEIAADEEFEEEEAAVAGSTASPTADAAEETAERGADLVTTGGRPLREPTVVVEGPASPLAAPPPAAPPPPPAARTLRAGARREPETPTPVRRGIPSQPRATATPSPTEGSAYSSSSTYSTDGPTRKKREKRKKGRIDQEAVDATFRKTMAAMEGSGRRKRKTRETGPSAQERREEERQRVRQEEAQTVRVNEFLTVSELGELIDIPSSQIIGSAFKNLGLMVTINQRLDFDQIELLLDEFGFRAVREEEYGAEMEEVVAEDLPEDLAPRPPVVTVMGHVDHGKTSLLDYIRKANVIAGEAGGITQHIGAYHVELGDDRTISFLDTPGHAAFTAMRARGAEVTDVVILVVAADDSVMPQTIEAISHARNAGVPLIVAVNKIDLPDAEPNRVKQDLLQHGVVLEEFGGTVLSAEVSAKQGKGIDELLEKVLLQAELLELKANADREAVGTVIEAQLDVGKGPVATVLVTNGTLRVGDDVVCGLQSGRIRAMLDERSNPVQEAGPAIPVQILGLSGVPAAGDQLLAMEADRAAEIAQTRQRLDREKRMRIRSRGVKLTDLSKLLARGERVQLNLVIKGDVDGSVQALSDSLEQLSTSEVEVDVIHRGVGAINESDVLLASTSGAIVIGFHVRPMPDARAAAEREDVDIRLYNIIYEAVEEVRAAMEGMLSPEEREVLLGTAEVRQLFKVPRVGTVAGCMVTGGEIQRRGRVRVVRDGIEVYAGELGSLKRFKDDVREVREGFECGLNVANFNDIKVGDTIECYRVEEVARTLTAAAEA